MRIGIDASRAARPVRSGTETYSLHLIRSLVTLDSGHRFVLYLDRTPPPDLFLSSPSVDLRVIPFPRLWTHIRLSAEMALRPPDVLFVPAHSLPLVRPRRSVVTVHDLGYVHFPAAHTRRARWYLDLSTRFSARVATQVVCDSDATRADLQLVYRIPHGKMDVVYPGATPGMGRVQDAGAVRETLTRYGVPVPYFLYVGTLQPRKNLVRLIESLALVPEPVCLVLAGRRGWLAQGILRRAEELGIADRVRFTGYVPECDLPALYTGAAAFVFPSLYEGFGIPVLEAMACGTPVICSGTSSLPEVTGDAALWVDPTDVASIAAAMKRIMADPALAADLSRRGIARAAEFTWERCARQTLAVLERAGGAK